MFLRLLLKARNAAAASRIDGAKPMQWQPLKASQAIGRAHPQS